MKRTNPRRTAWFPVSRVLRVLRGVRELLARTKPLREASGFVSLREPRPQRFYPNTLPYIKQPEPGCPVPLLQLPEATSTTGLSVTRRRERPDQTSRKEPGVSGPVHTLSGGHRVGSSCPSRGARSPPPAHPPPGKRSRPSSHHCHRSPQGDVPMCLHPTATAWGLFRGVTARTPPALPLPLSFTSTSSSSFRLSCQRGTSTCRE